MHESIPTGKLAAIVNKQTHIHARTHPKSTARATQWTESTKRPIDSATPTLLAALPLQSTHNYKSRLSALPLPRIVIATATIVIAGLRWSTRKQRQRQRTTERAQGRKLLCLLPSGDMEICESPASIGWIHCLVPKQTLIHGLSWRASSGIFRAFERQRDKPTTAMASVRSEI